MTYLGTFFGHLWRRMRRIDLTQPIAVAGTRDIYFDMIPTYPREVTFTMRAIGSNRSDSE